MAGLAAILSLMLPTHRRQTDHETPFSGSAVQVVKLCFSRPSSRWMLFCLAFASSLWFLGPYFLHMNDLSRPYRHGHQPPENYFPIADERGRNPLGPGARLRPPRPIPAPIGSSTIWSTRAAQVKEAYLHAWNGYQKLAAPFDELLPVSDGKVNK